MQIRHILIPRWPPQCSCVVIESSFDPGERLQAPGSLWFDGSVKILLEYFFWYSCTCEEIFQGKKYVSCNIKKTIYSSFIVLYCSSLTTKHFHFSTLITKQKKFKMILYSSCHRHWIVPLVILVSSTRMYNLHSVISIHLYFWYEIKLK